jgi:peroxiredoxin
MRSFVLVKLFPPSVVNIGDDMVDAKLLDINGKKMQLSDYINNKYLLLNFCSIGCGYCIESLPEMKEVLELYNDKISLININVDTKSKWQESMLKHDIPGINVRDPKSHFGLAGKYGNDLSVPYYVIISPEGKVVDKWFGFSQGLIKRKVSEIVLKS